MWKTPDATIDARFKLSSGNSCFNSLHDSIQSNEPHCGPLRLIPSANFYLNTFLCCICWTAVSHGAAVDLRKSVLINYAAKLPESALAWRRLRRLPREATCAVRWFHACFSKCEFEMSSFYISLIRSLTMWGMQPKIKVFSKAGRRLQGDDLALWNEGYIYLFSWFICCSFHLVWQEFSSKIQRWIVVVRELRYHLWQAAYALLSLTEWKYDLQIKHMKSVRRLNSIAWFHVFLFP